jgi:membrane protease YdiL (CAAX protease family)
VNPGRLFVGAEGRIRAPWRMLFFLLATPCAGLLVASIFYPLIELTPVPAYARAWGVPLDQLGALLAILIGTYATVRIADGVRDGIWTRVALGPAAFNWRALAIGLAAGTLAILIPCAILLATRRFEIERQPELQSWAHATRGALFLFIPAALVEELMVRGYLLTVLRETMGKPGAVAITSVMFALLHLFNPGPTLISTATVALAGVFLATIRLVTNSLYAAWVAHLAWNLVQSVVFHAPVSGLPLPTPGYRLVDHGPAWLTGGAWGPEGGAAAAAGMLVTTFLLVWRPGRGDQSVSRAET